MKITKFENLECWKLSLHITKLIYDVSAKRDFGRDYFLRDQVRRSIVSVSANVVEGFEKNNNNEFIRFLKIAKGSVGETRNHLYVALAVDYITQEEFDEINILLEKLSGQIGAFITYLSKKREERTFKKK